MQQLADHARLRVAEAARLRPKAALAEQARALPRGDFPFLRALQKPGLSFICECKKASPSKGVIAPDFQPVEIARAYEAAGADCISVLTEPKWFLGRDEYLKDVARAVNLPCLRKDFVVDDAMILEAKLLGAAAVLLIVSLLSDEQLCEYAALCDELGLSALTEVHTEREVQRALAAGANIIGVNNRNLHDFSVDGQTAERLRALVPPGVAFVAESGMATPADAAAAAAYGADAVLVGEALMRASDRAAVLRAFREGAVCG